MLCSNYILCSKGECTSSQAFSNVCVIVISHTIKPTFLSLIVPCIQTHKYSTSTFTRFLLRFPAAGNDLDSIRALFSEKEKELSLAVAKVDALTRQLEDVRRDRRAPLVLIPGSGVVGSSGASTATGTNGNAATSPAALELDKLRRELMVSFVLWFCWGGGGVQ